MKFTKRLIAILTFSILPSFIYGQNSYNKELNQKLENKNNFQDCWQTISKYYSSNNYRQNPKLYSEFEKWNRWAWWQSRHLDANGNMENNDLNQYNTLLSLTIEKSNKAARTTFSNTGNWNFVGPYNINEGIARVDRIAFHPTDPNILYCGTPSGGLWKTVDGGNNWFSVNGFSPQVGVSGIVVDYSNPNTIYVLTGEFASSTGNSYSRNCIGVLKSTDGGNTWKLLNKVTNNNKSFGGNGYKLIQMPNDPNKLFASTSNGLFYTTDGGQTWQTYQSTYILKDMLIKPGSNGQYIFGYDSSTLITYSNDYGVTFLRYSIHTTNNFLRSFTGNIKLATSNKLPNRIFFEVSGKSKPLPGDTLASVNKVFFTDNNFNTVTLVTPTNGIAPGVENPYYAAIGVSNVDANIFLSGNQSLVRSTDGGANFGSIIQQGIHSDFHDIVSNPLNNYMYACTDGGVYLSTDQGANWTYKGRGIAATQFYHMSATILNDEVNIAGAQDNGFMRRDNAGNSFLVRGGDGFSGKFLNNDQNTFIYSVNEQVLKYNISTSNNSVLYTPFVRNESNFFPSIEVHPTNNNIIYAGYPTGLRRSLNGGATWDSTMNLSGSAGFALSGGIAVSQQYPDRIYIANNSILKVSNDKGITSSVISGNPGWVNITGPITDVATNANNANEVWITFGGNSGTKVLYSPNAGTNWTDFTGTLPQLPVYCVKYTTDGDAYIGTDAGVYFMDFAMNDWVFFSNGLPPIPVTDLFINENTKTIKASTFGRGIWKSDLYADCATSLALNGSPLGSKFYQANGMITTLQNISGSFGNEVIYRSPTQIKFTDGFKAFEGSFVKTVIGPCGQGVVLNSVNSNTTKMISKDLTMFIKR